MNRSTIEEEEGRLLGDKGHTRWDIGTLRARNALAEIDVQVLTGAVQTIITSTPVAETFGAEISAHATDIKRVTLTDADGTVHVLQGKSRQDLDYYYPNWENRESGLPEVFSADYSEQQILLVPKPSAAYAITNALKVWEVRYPSGMVDPTSEPFDDNYLMRPYHLSVVHWTVAQCFMDDGDPTALSKSKFHRSGDMNNPGEYEKVIKEINMRYNIPSTIPTRIKWMPQGGRLGGMQSPTKSYPWG